MSEAVHGPVDLENPSSQPHVDEAAEVSTFPVPTFAKSPVDVLCSKFVVVQLIFNVIASFLGPLGTFFLLFGYLTEGPYAWSSGPCVGVVVGSLAGSPLLIFALMPVGMPEAVENGWFPRLRVDACPPWLLRWCPFLNDHPKWKWGTKRNLVLGLMLGVVYVPVALLIAGLALGPMLGTWVLIWFNVVFEVLLAVPVVSFGLLGYAMDHNLDSTIDQMSSHPNLAMRIVYRSLTSLKMTICP